MKTTMKRSSQQFEIYIRQEIAKQNMLASSVYQKRVQLIGLPVQENEELIEEFKVKTQSKLKNIWEKLRHTYLRWISLVLIEPCLIRWEAPDRFLERHEFENVESRSPLGPARFF